MARLDDGVDTMYIYIAIGNKPLRFKKVLRHRRPLRLVRPPHPLQVTSRTVDLLQAKPVVRLDDGSVYYICMYVYVAIETFILGSE